MTKSSNEIHRFLKEREASRKNLAPEPTDKGISDQEESGTFVKGGFIHTFRHGLREYNLLTRADEAFRAIERFNKIYNYVTDAARVVVRYTRPLWGPTVTIAKIGWSVFKWSSFEKESRKYDANGALNLTLRGRVASWFSGKGRIEESDNPEYFKTDYKRDADGDLVFSKSKFARSFALAAALAVGTVPVATTLRDAYHVATATEQTHYFGKPEFNADRNMYQVTACQSKEKCEGGDNTMIFDIPDNNALDIYYTLVRAKGYDPEHEVVSAFNSDYQVCKVMAKGDKPIVFNYVLGSFRWHPKLLESPVCTPVINMMGNLPMNQEQAMNYTP